MEEESLLDTGYVSGAIELKPEVAKQRQDAYSSLTDLHGIDLFTDEFRGKKDIVEKNYEKDAEQLQEMIFDKEKNMTNENDDWVISNMFINQNTMILKPDYEKRESKISIMEIGAVLIAVLIVTAIYLFIFGKKKRQ